MGLDPFQTWFSKNIFLELKFHAFLNIKNIRLAILSLVKIPWRRPVQDRRRGAKTAGGAEVSVGQGILAELR